LEWCEFVGVEFDRTDFGHAILHDCDLRDTSFRQAKLNDAKFVRSDFYGAVFEKGTSGARVHFDSISPPSSFEGVSGLRWAAVGDRPAFVSEDAPGYEHFLKRSEQEPDARPIVDSMRVVKDADEVSRLRRAVDISVAGHIAAMRAARAGMWEYELEAALEDGFRRNGADRLGYPSIVGSGPNSTTLHYDVNRRKTENGDLVVIDAAAEWGQYTADVTRTFPGNGKFTPRQKAIYDLVLGAQQAAFDAVRPGVTMRQLDDIARRYMREHSGNLCGQLTCDDREFFNHGLGHPIGMDVHDVGISRPLEPGMVITLEPGIYIQAEQLGVRIEDDVLVTAKGGEWLSAGAPRTTDAIEKLMSGR